MNILLELLKTDIKKFNQYLKDNLNQIEFSHPELFLATLWGSYSERATLYGVKINLDGMKMLINCIGITVE